MVSRLGWARIAGFLALAVAGALSSAPSARAEPWGYIEHEYEPRVYGGDDDARLARAHFVHGDYGLAQVHYLRAVQATPQNSAAWTGLAASYDRIGRFDLAAQAYRQAERHGAVPYVILNNRGYGYLLRGDRRAALRLFFRAHDLAPHHPTIINNISIAESGQGYFWTGATVIPLPDGAGPPINVR